VPKYNTSTILVHTAASGGQTDEQHAMVLLLLLLHAETTAVLFKHCR